LNAYGGKVSATFSNGSFYTPGQPVTIQVSVSDPVNSVWHGFQMSARLDSDNSQAGTFRPATGSVVFCADGSVEGTVRTKTGTCPNNQIEYITHTEPSTGTWTYSWIAPASNVGPIHFYLAGNAVNHNDMEDAGDHVYTKAYVLNPLNALCTQSLPTISEVRRIEGWGDGNTFSTGSWLQIKGSNLAPFTGPWLDADFVDGVARTSLAGTSVSINGKSGFVEYVSPTQLNVQAPADSFTGAVPVTVTNCSGTSSPLTPPNLQKLAVAPGVLAPDNQYFNFGGKQYAEATFGFQYQFVGNLGPALPSRPAKPGDSILLYAIGLGDTTPANTPGGVATGLEVLNAPVLVNFGSTPATVNRVGLYPTFAGLYYIMLTVPTNLADNDYQVNVTVGGQPLVQNPFYLTVHK